MGGYVRESGEDVGSGARGLDAPSLASVGAGERKTDKWFAAACAICDEEKIIFMCRKKWNCSFQCGQSSKL